MVELTPEIKCHCLSPPCGGERSAGRWRKRKGNAQIKLDSGETVRAEIHWYEATGIGKGEFKIKRILEVQTHGKS
jgi:hypothetical protein